MIKEDLSRFPFLFEVENILQQQGNVFSKLLSFKGNFKQKACYQGASTNTLSGNSTKKGLIVFNSIEAYVGSALYKVTF